MRKYAQLGAGVTLVCGARGEAGEIAPGVNATPATLGQVREEELRSAAEKISEENCISRLHRFGNDGRQGKCKPPQFVEHGYYFKVPGKLVKFIRRHKPEVILTFEQWRLRASGPH